jgi:translation initiation factor IF-2
MVKERQLMTASTVRVTDMTPLGSEQPYAAVSILYKTRLPLIIVFNKIDVVRHETMQGWMEDFDKFHAVIDENPTFASDLSRSLSLVLDEFYKNLRMAGVSAMTGEGMEELFDVIGRARKEYLDEYFPELREKKAARAAEDEARRVASLQKLRKDMSEGGGRGEKVVMDMNDKTPEQGADSNDDDEYDGA